MDIFFKNDKYPFQAWKPEHGRVMTRTFAFDTETTLIDEARPWVPPAYVLGAAFDGKRGVFVPRDRVEDFFKVHEGLPCVMHNAPFDLKVVHQVAPKLDIYKAVDENRVWDTQLLHQLLTLGTAGHVAGGKGQTTLERVAKKYLGFDLSKDVKDADGDLVRLSYGKFLKSDPKDIPAVYLQYLALDVIATLRAYVKCRRELAAMLRAAAGTYGYVSREWLREQFRKHGPQTHHTQLKAAIVLGEISAAGLHVDQGRRGPLAKELAGEVQRLRGELARHGYLPGKGSQTALQAILKRLSAKFPNVRWPLTTTGKFASGKDALADVAGFVPFVELLLNYKAAEKLKASFFDKLTGSVIRTRFRTMTRSGRTSSHGDLNVQNLPRGGGVRECFIPSPGHVFLAADYSTIELVTLAQACESQFGLKSKMAEAIRNGQDLHRLVASQVTGKGLEHVTDDERSKAKPINFGKPGGMGLATLRAYAKQNYGVEYSEEDVQKLSDAWFATFPEMLQFLGSENEQVQYRAAKTFGLTAADHAAKTGDNRFLYFANTERLANRPNRFLGAMLLKTAGDPFPKKVDNTPYRDSDVEYFWEKLQTFKDRLPDAICPTLMKREAGYGLKRAVRSLCDRAGVFTLTGRLRANTGYCQRHNTIFQGLAADGAKLAMWKLWRAGLRLVNFVHDEFIAEVPEGDDLTATAATVKRLMVAGMKEVVPTLPVAVEACAMRRWYKKAKPVFDTQGRLIVWEPKPQTPATPAISF